MNGGDPPSPDAVRCCPLCRRLYSSHATYNRHVLYCRKARARPRTRTISCRSCMAAKAKCTSETPCQRCTKKGILCVYASPGLAQERSRHDPPPPAVEPASIPLMTPHSSAGTPFAWNDLFREGTSIPPGGEQPGQPWDAGDIVSAGSSTSKVMDYTMPLSYAQNWEIALADDGHQLPGAFSPEPPTPETTMSAESSPQESTALVMSEIPDTAFLARVPIGNPVLHFTSTLVMQNLRAFVQMMARKETFPPFIHSHWYQKSTTGTSALPEPLVNCMGVAQMFASRTRETKQFLWRTVRMEQRSFIQKQDDQSYSACELLAAIQAQIIYIIMRAVDDEHLELDLNQEMVVTHQVLCESFARMLNQPFCRDERRFPSSSWEEWVFAESRRRTVYVWFLIAQIFRVKTGVPCAVLNGYRSLPLTSPKALWEARTSLEWQTEYQTYQVLPRIGLETFGDLVHACKDGIAVRCDAWNATADNLGMLLRLGAQMMTCDF